MAIRRVFASKDTTIANFDPAYSDVSISGSNMGASEILNLYRVVDNSAEAKILMDFGTVVVPSGSEIYLNVFDAQHDQQMAAGYNILVEPIDKDWSEGIGQDLDYYTDLGVANWVSATLTSSWDAPGVVSSPAQQASFYIQSGNENVELNVTAMTASNGYALMIDPAFSASDIYIKKFHSRNTHFLAKRPYLEVRWTDWSGTFDTVTKYLVTAPGPWSGSLLDEPINYYGSGTVPAIMSASTPDPTGALLFKMPNLKSDYETSEISRLRVNVYPKDWNLSTVVQGTSDLPVHVLTEAYYRISDDVTGDILVPFGTGSLQHTRLSWDPMGNFFDFYFSTITPGLVCTIDFLYNVGGVWTMSRPHDFKFRVK